MDAGLWSATSGAVAKSAQLDMLAQNLANVNTDGYKRDEITFHEYLAEAEAPLDLKDIAPGPIREKELYPLSGKSQAMVVVDGVHVRHEAGLLRETRRPLDVALDGSGFFEILTPQGIQYTRLGAFQISPEGKLITSDGSFVLARKAGALPEKRTIEIPRNLTHPIQISDTGEIYGGQESLAELSLLSPKDLSKLQKASHARFLAPSDLEFNPAKVRVLQGSLEGSNVNPIQEMSRLIRTSRLFEHDLKALRSVGEMMGKESNEIGKL